LKIRVLFIFILIGTLLGCSGPVRLSSQNLAYIYQKEKNLLESKMVVHHLNAVNSDLHFSISSKNLLYSKKPDDNTYSAKLKLSYVIFKSFDNTEIVDSASHWINDTTQILSNDNIYAKIPLRLAYPGQYVIKVTVSDLIKNIFEHKIISVNKSDFVSAQNFLVVDKKTDLPLLTNAIQNREVKVFYSYKDVEQLNVYQYNRLFQIPPPPFSNQSINDFDFTPDQTYGITINDSNYAKIKIPEGSFGMISSSVNTTEGVTLFNFNETYPKLKSPLDMVAPMRYICTNKEFGELLNAENHKKAVDTYWLRCASGDAKTAKILIQNYYHRVEEANNYFTSYVEGWKTDRGMINIIFGKPSVVYVNETTQTWIYGEENTQSALQFQFQKVNNPFTEKDYRLIRSPLHKNPWYAMVERWRKGRITDEY
jgi:GWxTD domain-containing protein|tara:strand:- start:47181 stop:48452 length:1272 start_codon:yes stop_codon:yes gene_type:complete